MSNRPRPSNTPERRPLTRRQLEAHHREASAQRRAVLAIAGAVSLALLLIIAGFAYSKLYVPSKTLKTVNNQPLTRRQYDQLSRTNLIQQMAQSLQYSKLFGSSISLGQGSGTLSDQVVQVNTQIADIGSIASQQQPIDDSLVSAWVDRQILEQGAKAQFQINPSQGEVDQAIVAQYGSLLQTSPAVTATETVSGTTATTTAASPPASAGAAASPAATANAASGSPAASVAPTSTPLPTATPLPAEATQKANQIFDALYTELVNVLGSLPEEAPARTRTPHVTKDDLAQALRTQFREQVIRERVGETLVKEVPANDTSAPTEIRARHILLKVPKATPTPQPTAPASATETAQPATTATAEPTPTPTLSPPELDKLFAERKPEADALYQQLKANPASFAEVAKAKSEDPGSAAQGGDVGSFNRDGQTQQGGSLVKPFVDAAWALKDNEISQPVRSEFGWHIIQRLPEDPQTKLERLRTQALDKWLAEQRQKATIIPAPTPTPTELPPVTTETAQPDTTETAQPDTTATTTP